MAVRHNVRRLVARWLGDERILGAIFVAALTHETRPS